MSKCDWGKREQTDFPQLKEHQSVSPSGSVFMAQYGYSAEVRPLAVPDGVESTAGGLVLDVAAGWKRFIRHSPSWRVTRMR